MARTPTWSGFRLVTGVRYPTLKSAVLLQFVLQTVLGSRERLTPPPVNAVDAVQVSFFLIDLLG
jgi:hypothetical protein